MNALLFAQSNLNNPEQNLVYTNKQGEILKYCIDINNDITEKSPSNNYKTENSYSNRTYYYTKEAKTTEGNGDIIFEIKFDSIICVDGNESAVNRFSYGSSHCYRYNPIDVDSNDFLTYFVLVNEPFSIRVNRYGEILEAFGLYNIHKNLFAVYKDTLNDSEKESLRGSISSEELSTILQQEYIFFPAGSIDENGSWTRKVKAEIVYWEAESTVKYKLTDTSGEFYYFNGDLKTKILGKEYTEGSDIKILVDDFSGSGSGKIIFERNRNCIKQKDSVVKVMIKMKLYTKDDSGYSRQTVDTKLKVTLLN